MIPEISVLCMTQTRGRPSPQEKFRRAHRSSTTPTTSVAKQLRSAVATASGLLQAARNREACLTRLSTELTRALTSIYPFNCRNQGLYSRFFMRNTVLSTPIRTYGEQQQLAPVDRAAAQFEFSDPGRLFDTPRDPCELCNLVYERPTLTTQIYSTTQ